MIEMMKKQNKNKTFCLPCDFAKAVPKSKAMKTVAITIEYHGLGFSSGVSPTMILSRRGGDIIASGLFIFESSMISILLN